MEVTSLLVFVLSKESLPGSSLAARGRDGEDSYPKKILDVKISFTVTTFATSKSSFTFKGLSLSWTFREIKCCDLAIKGLTLRVSLRRLIKKMQSLLVEMAFINWFPFKMFVNLVSLL